MNKHTPGPWEHRGNRVYRKDSYEVAWIAGQGPHSEWQANAQLIAAAPAMYEALQATLAYFLRSQQSHAPEVAVITKALAQAEGRVK
jgi:hypothetical protein